MTHPSSIYDVYTSNKSLQRKQIRCVECEETGGPKIFVFDIVSRTVAIHKEVDSQAHCYI